MNDSPSHGMWAAPAGAYLVTPSFTWNNGSNCLAYLHVLCARTHAEGRGARRGAGDARPVSRTPENGSWGGRAPPSGGLGLAVRAPSCTFSVYAAGRV